MPGLPSIVLLFLQRVQPKISILQEIWIFFIVLVKFSLFLNLEGASAFGPQK